MGIVPYYIIIYKLASGLIELFLGIGILLFGTKLVGVYQSFKINELLENPHDIEVSILEKIIPYIFNHEGYIVLILIIFGLIKIFGSIGLIYRKHWGLDILIGWTILLLPFDGYYLLTNPSLMKVAYFLINIFIALYLVNFKPKKYFSNLKHRIKV